MTFPFEVEVVEGTAALERRNALTAENRGYPIIAGPADNLERLAEDHAAAVTDNCVEAASEIDVDDWLARRAASDPEYYQEEHGEWPSDVGPASAVLGHRDVLSGEPLAEVAIVLVPTSHSWQVPCQLGYGGWNECPAGAEHSAILRRWQERYAATLVTVTPDTIELGVGRPVSTREEALALAREQYVYCADIVQQGTETIEGLAATLLNASVWFFWWD
jgi:uncharacterized protein DUF4253